jgi:hypothetical protein
MFDELADRVFRRRYESLDLNVGVVIAEDGVLVIDTRASHAEADQLLADLVDSHQGAGSVGHRHPLALGPHLWQRTIPRR